MKTKEKEFISEIVSADFKNISNPDFTHDTINRISESKSEKPGDSKSGDITFLVPQFLYAVLFILLSIITIIISWTQNGQKSMLADSIEMVLDYLLNPVTISILFSFSILYLIDLYLNRIKA